MTFFEGLEDMVTGRSVVCEPQAVHRQIRGAFRVRERAVVDSGAIEARSHAGEVESVGDRAWNRDSSAANRVADLVGDGSGRRVNVEGKRNRRLSDESCVRCFDPSGREQRESSLSCKRVVSEAATEHADVVAVDVGGRRIDGYNELCVREALVHGELECGGKSRRTIGAAACVDFPVVAAAGKRTRDVLRSVGEEFVEPCAVRGVNAAAGVPFAVPVGDESVGYVGYLPHEGGALGYDLHGFSLKFKV